MRREFLLFVFLTVPFNEILADESKITDEEEALVCPRILGDSKKYELPPEWVKPLPQYQTFPRMIPLPRLSVPSIKVLTEEYPPKDWKKFEYNGMEYFFVPT